jgi:hypothetical protein
MSANNDMIQPKGAKMPPIKEFKEEDAVMEGNDDEEVKLEENPVI